MSYLDFHLLFNLPAFVVLLVLTRHRLRRAHVGWIAAIAAGAFVVTTPWDNWAVHRGIWGFDWERVTPVTWHAFGETWRLPLEEYAFFVIEVVLVGLLTVLFLPHPGLNSRDGGEGDREEAGGEAAGGR